MLKSFVVSSLFVFPVLWLIMKTEVLLVNRQSLDFLVIRPQIPALMTMIKCHCARQEDLLRLSQGL